jgi:HK97 gp10 family phage protein
LKIKAQEIAKITTQKKGRTNHIQGFDMEVEGIEELMEAFAQLSEDAILKLSDPSVEAAKIVLEKAKSKTNDLTGELDKNLKITKPGRRKGRAYQVFAKVGFGEKAMHGVPLELGHRIMRDGKQIGTVKEKPFLRPAADETKGKVVEIMVNAMNKILDEMGGRK